MSKLERQHLKEVGVKTKADLEKLFEYQRSQRRNQKITIGSEPCFVCKSLALKMGYKIK